MIQARFASALALAAFLAAPAFAQTSSSTTVDGATVAPLEKNAAKQSATAPAKQTKADSKVTTTSGNATDMSPATRTTDGARVAPLEKNAANQQAAADARGSTSMASTPTTKTAPETSASPQQRTAPLDDNARKQQAMADHGKPPCDEHPQAGKLADKSTGKAKEHSASPVHSDCVVDPATGMNAKPGKDKKVKKTASTH